MSERRCPIDDRPVEGNAKRRYCSRACQQTAYRRRRGIAPSKASVRRSALAEATRLRDADEGAALRTLGFDVDLIVAGLETHK